MKKFLMVLGIAVLLAPVTFAEISLSGALNSAWNVFRFQGEELNNAGDKGFLDSTGAGFNLTRFQVTFSATNADGDTAATLGAQGRVRMFATAGETGAADKIDAAVAWVWWQPIKQVKVTVGGIDAGYPGEWGTKAEDALGLSNFGGGGDKILTGFGKAGGLIELSLVENLELGVNIGGTFDTLGAVHAAGRYTLPGVGDVRFGVLGANSPKKGDEKKGYTYLSASRNSNVVEAAFNFAPEGSAYLAQAGVKIPIPTADYWQPILVALAGKYDANNFSGLFHFYTEFGGTAPDGTVDADKLGTALAFTIAGSYNLGSLIAGVDVTLDSREYAQWFLTPYVQIPLAGGNFYGGIKFGSGIYTDPTTKEKKNQTVWALPIGFDYSF
ncbi:hypothetical protein PilKf_00717 [Pillotina sp. SPG140]|jgi:hypothetical protein